MNEVSLVAEQLGRKYEDDFVVDNISFEIRQGRVIALLGPNGAGKSTLFKLIGGLIDAHEGEVRFFGENVRQLPVEKLSAMALMIDGFEPPAWATGKDLLNLQQVASSTFDRALAEEIFKSRELPLWKRYGKMSKGQKRWALAAVTLASHAALTLLDEPADGLDTAARRLLYERIRQEVNDRGNSVVIATHSIHDIERLADEVMIIKGARLLLHEDLDDLKDRIREVYCYSRRTKECFNEKITVLGEQQQKDSSTFWIQLPDGDDTQLLQLFEGEAEISRVDLETLYLALTEHAAEDEQ